MAWFGGKKKTRKKQPVLEPVGVPAVQAAPVGVPAAQAYVAQPALQPVGNQLIPAVQAAPVAVQSIPALQPVIEIAPIGVTADSNVMVSTEPVSTPAASGAVEWAKKSEKPLLDIHKRLDHMMDSKGKSLEDRYKERFGDILPESVTTDSARKEYNENKAKDTDKPNIVFKPRSQLKLTPKNRSKQVAEKVTETKTKVEVKDDSVSIGSKIGGGIKAGGAKTKSVIGSAGAKTKSAIGSAGAAVGRGAGAVKSGIGSGASRIIGLFRKNKIEKATTKKTSKPSKAKKNKNNYNSMKLAELKAELKKKGLKTSGKKAELIKRLE